MSKPKQDLCLLSPDELIKIVKRQEKRIEDFKRQLADLRQDFGNAHLLGESQGRQQIINQLRDLLQIEDHDHCHCCKAPLEKTQRHCDECLSPTPFQFRE